MLKKIFLTGIIIVSDNRQNNIYFERGLILEISRYKSEIEVKRRKRELKFLNYNMKNRKKIKRDWSVEQRTFKRVTQI